MLLYIIAICYNISMTNDKKKRGYYRNKIKKKSPSIEKGIIPRNEFRENTAIYPPHTVHVYGYQGNFMLCIAITHAPRTKRKTNIKMHNEPNKSPKPEDIGRDSYFVPFPMKTHRSKMGKVKNDWVLGKEDDELMKPFREH